MFFKKWPRCWLIDRIHGIIGNSHAVENNCCIVNNSITVKSGESVNNNRIALSFIKCAVLIYSCKRGRHNKFSSLAARLFTPQSIADNNRSIPSCRPRCDDGWWRDHGALSDPRLINRPRRTGLNVFLRQCVCACVYSCVLDSCVTLMNVWEQIP